MFLSLLGDVLPLLLQVTGEVVHIKRCGVVFGHSSKNVPDMLDGRQIRQVGRPVHPEDPLLLLDVCNDLSSVRSGVVVLATANWRQVPWLAEQVG